MSEENLLLVVESLSNFVTRKKNMYKNMFQTFRLVSMVVLFPLNLRRKSKSFLEEADFRGRKFHVSIHSSSVLKWGLPV
jgi:hypothetical protein